MKKITTFLMMLLVVTFGFSQQEVLQDFEDGGLGGPFGEASASIVDDPKTGGTNGKVAMLSSNSSGTVWQGVNVALSKNVELTTDKTMKMDIYSTTAITIAPKVVSGVDGAPDSTTSVSHTGDGWETLTFTFDQGLDGSNTANGVYSAFVIYYNWDTGDNGFGTQDSRVFYVDNISGVAVEPVQDPEPETAAPTPPARNESDVISIFSDAYTDISVDTYDTSWCPGTTTEVMIDGNATKKISGLGCEGIEWQSARTVNASQMTHFHMDIWTDSETQDKSFNMKFSNWAGGAAEANAIEFSATNATNLPNTNPGTWISFDISLSDWSAGDINDIVQFIITSNLGTVYYDNLYLYSDTPLSNNDFSKVEFNVYPNPASNQWTIDGGSSSIEKVKVYNLTGKLVLEASGKQQSTVQLDASQLSSGVYLANIQAGGSSKSIKLIKK
jgi:hypothetical protein